MNLQYHWYSEQNLRPLIWAIFFLMVGAAILDFLAVGLFWGIRFDTPFFLYPFIGGVTIAWAIYSLRPILKKLWRG